MSTSFPAHTLVVPCHHNLLVPQNHRPPHGPTLRHTHAKDSSPNHDAKLPLGTTTSASSTSQIITNAAAQCSPQFQKARLQPPLLAPSGSSAIRYCSHDVMQQPCSHTHAIANRASTLQQVTPQGRIITTPQQHPTTQGTSQHPHSSHISSCSLSPSKNFEAKLPLYVTKNSTPRCQSEPTLLKPTTDPSMVR